MPRAVSTELNELEEFVLNCLRNHGHGDEKWMRPMDLGRPSSQIHQGLKGLIKKGYVERQPRAGHGGIHTHQRTPYVYRLKEEFWASKLLSNR